MITQDEQNRLSFEQSKAEWDAYQKIKRSLRHTRRKLLVGCDSYPAVPNAVSPLVRLWAQWWAVLQGALTAQTGGWGAIPGAGDGCGSG